MRRTGFSSGLLGLSKVWLFVAAFFVGSAGVQAQVVQLPQFEFFGVNTTVSVPDRGSVNSGGINRSQYAYGSRAVPGAAHFPYAGRAFGNRSVAGGAAANGVNVSAQIHDFAAMEESLEAGGTAARRSLGGEIRRSEATNRRTTAGDMRHATRASSSPLADVPQASVRELRSGQAKLRNSDAVEAVQYLARGKQQLAAGKPGVARVYLQIAARRGDAETQRQAAVELQSISSGLARAGRP